MKLLELQTCCVAPLSRRKKVHDHHPNHLLKELK